MSLYFFFKLLTCLPTTKEARLYARTAEGANNAIEEGKSASARENKKSVQVSDVENGNGAEGWSMQLFKRNHV